MPIKRFKLAASHRSKQYHYWCDFLVRVGDMIEVTTSQPGLDRFLVVRAAPAETDVEPTQRAVKVIAKAGTFEDTSAGRRRAWRAYKQSLDTAGSPQ